MPHRLTVTIPGNIQPLERGARFADPLDQALKVAALGEIGDEGTQMGVVDGRLGIIAADIEVTVSDLDSGLALIRKVLKAAGAPAATTITQREPIVVVHPL